MKANGPEPNLKTFREVVIQAIEGEISNFDFIKVYDTINFIHELESFSYLKNLSNEKRKIINSSLLESMLNGHADDYEYFYPVWQKFAKFVDDVETQSI